MEMKLYSDVISIEILSILLFIQNEYLSHKNMFLSKEKDVIFYRL